jgi:hypothetical protein
MDFQMAVLTARRLVAWKDYYWVAQMAELSGCLKVVLRARKKVVLMGY